MTPPADEFPATPAEAHPLADLAGEPPPDVWTFDVGSITHDERHLPHVRVVCRLNGKAVGEAEVHIHKRAGRDKVTDLSWGFTAITYGPLNPGTVSR